MKYTITKKTKTIDGIILHQIKAKETKNSIKKGELSGWIEKKENLSQSGNAWVSGGYIQ